MGQTALYSNTTGTDNIALGQTALHSNKTGSWNVALGQGALQNNITGCNNIALGWGALGADVAFAGLSNVLVLNNTGADVPAPGTSVPDGSFWVGAIGEEPSTSSPRHGLQWNATTREVTWSTAKSFVIPHPEHEGKMLRHACIEAPTRGTNIYEYQFETTESNQITHVALPSYFKHINGRPRVYVSAESISAGLCGGKVNDELTAVVVETEHPGVFNVMVTGIRKDAGAVGYSATEYIDEPIAPEDIPPSQTVVCCGSNYGKK
jgi:hypothetical protein